MAGIQNSITRGVPSRNGIGAVAMAGLPGWYEKEAVAAEMEREGFECPLLIGGATTSRVHTAVKISPNYNRGQAVYVTDASRAVGVVSNLLSPDTKVQTIESVRAEYKRVADAHARSEADKQRLPLTTCTPNMPLCQAWTPMPRLTWMLMR